MAFKIFSLSKIDFPDCADGLLRAGIYTTRVRKRWLYPLLFSDLRICPQ